ncbi:TetR/AcrR family transcriptional regulator [Ornithinimicrobium avium]|uniref:TetR/AcrR family transcriptional regulator n=1 Tax=Ornithinimicrobium avium TaxID=2283195 RepID=UPI0013B38095|nr:TetR/AcrR family transcriptional regulator [Ornithinimicrobium avium]
MDHLLFVEGVIATPVDDILKLAEASPPSLYKHFGSKDGLITAALERRLAVWTRYWDEAMEQAGTQLERVLSVWPALRAYQTTSLEERWCAFSGTTAAIKDKSEELTAVLEAETRLLRTRTAALVDELGLAPRASARLTNELVIAYLGTMAMMLREPYLHAIDDGEATARSLLQAALTRADGPARDLVDELVAAGQASR